MPRGWPRFCLEPRSGKGSHARTRPAWQELLLRRPILGTSRATRLSGACSRTQAVQPQGLLSEDTSSSQDTQDVFSPRWGKVSSIARDDSQQATWFYAGPLEKSHDAGQMHTAVRNVTKSRACTTSQYLSWSSGHFQELYSLTSKPPTSRAQVSLRLMAGGGGLHVSGDPCSMSRRAQALLSRRVIPDYGVS